jgi:hypothetical protein
VVSFHSVDTMKYFVLILENYKNRIIVGEITQNSQIKWTLLGIPENVFNFFVPLKGYFMSLIRISIQVGSTNNIMQSVCYKYDGTELGRSELNICTHCTQISLLLGPTSEENKRVTYVTIGVHNGSKFSINTQNCHLQQITDLNGRPDQNTHTMITVYDNTNITLQRLSSYDISPVIGISGGPDVGTTEIGLLHVEWGTCPSDSQSSNNDNFECFCIENYKQHQNGTCSLCNETEFCPSTSHSTTTCTHLIEKYGKCICPLGYFYNIDQFICLECPHDWYCEDGLIHKCPGKTITKHEMSITIDDCICADGTYMHNKICTSCLMGFTCIQNRIQSCPPYTTTLELGGPCVCMTGYYNCTNSSDICYDEYMLLNPEPIQECVEVGIGYYLAAGSSATKMQCPENKTTIITTAGSIDECRCAASYKSTETTLCTKCENNELCPFNSSMMTTKCPKSKIVDKTLSTCVCIPGFFSNDKDVCEICPVGLYCNEGNGIFLRECPSFMTSVAQSSSINMCMCKRKDHQKIRISDDTYSCSCLDMYYQVGAECFPCPLHSNVVLTSKTLTHTIADCRCHIGYYDYTPQITQGMNISPKTCLPCELGHYCSHEADEKQVPCPYATFGPAMGHSSDTACIKCPDMISHKDMQGGHTSINHCIRSFIPMNTGHYKPTVIHIFFLIKILSYSIFYFAWNTLPGVLFEILIYTNTIQT